MNAQRLVWTKIPGSSRKATLNSVSEVVGGQPQSERPNPCSTLYPSTQPESFWGGGGGGGAESVLGLDCRAACSPDSKATHELAGRST